MSKIREKESLECVRMHIWASKTQKLPGPLSRPWTPAAECSLRSRDSASLRRQLSASEAGAPPWPNPGSAPAVTVLFAQTFWTLMFSVHFNLKYPKCLVRQRLSRSHIHLSRKHIWYSKVQTVKWVISEHSLSLYLISCLINKFTRSVGLGDG